MDNQPENSSAAVTCYTGLPGLDQILQSVRLGDNVVFQIDAIEDYRRFVEPFCAQANRQKRNLIYFRFADHDPVVPKGATAHVFKLKPEEGFENFISEIFAVIERFGQEAFYVFDSLSELSVDWYSDRMLGNFFRLTCPYLYDYRTVAYFAMLRNQHTAYATGAVHNTAQVVLDVYRDGENFYLAPLKVEGRHSGTMYTLHRWQKDEFVPVTSSAVVAQILTKVQQPWLGFAMERRDYWSRMFAQAAVTVKEPADKKRRTTDQKQGPLLAKLLRMAFSRDPRLLELAEEYLSLTDIAEIGQRMI
ncbi:MAG: pyruvate, phosphate dikinase, partial [Candidatus Omnitrophota bacterium]